MSFEEYVYRYLESKLTGYKLNTKIEDNSISVILGNSQQINRYVADSDLIITMRFVGKKTSSEATEAVKKVFKELNKENYVMQVYFISEMANAEGTPSYWEYACQVTVRHRRRDEWQL